MAKPTPKTTATKAPDTYGVARELRVLVERDGIDAVKLLYREFDRLNDAHFEGRLPPATILLTKPASPRAWADHCREDEHGLRYRIRMGDACAKRGARLLLDVLLHELVHVACNAIDNEPEPGYRGHGPRFADWCNRIGYQLCLPKVAPRGRGAPDCAGWPMNVRAPGFYPEAPAKRVKAPAKPKALPKGREEDDDQGDDGDRDAGELVGPARDVRVADLETAIKLALELLRRKEAKEARRVLLDALEGDEGEG